jgi:epoxide hydrolase
MIPPPAMPPPAPGLEALVEREETELRELPGLLAERPIGLTWLSCSKFDRGGHFPAMEVADLLVGDLRAFFGRLRRGGGQPGRTR